jgi:hypothetical protein
MTWLKKVSAVKSGSMIGWPTHDSVFHQTKNYAAMQDALSAIKTNTSDKGERMPVRENVRRKRPVKEPIQL